MAAERERVTDALDQVAAGQPAAQAADEDGPARAEHDADARGVELEREGRRERGLPRAPAGRGERVDLAIDVSGGEQLGRDPGQRARALRLVVARRVAG